MGCFFFKNNVHLITCNIENAILESCLFLHASTFISNIMVVYPLNTLDIFMGYGNITLETN